MPAVLTAALIPAEGTPLIVTPEFEEPSIRESLKIPAEVRVWNEHQNPAALIADWLKTHGAGSGPVGVEETVRFFAFDGLRTLGVETRGDAGVVRACRVIKSPAEIALMQAASDITIAAFGAHAVLSSALLPVLRGRDARLEASA